MIVLPNCKINLGLRIVRKRDDGYHDLETVFYPLPLRDVVEVIRDADKPRDKGIRFSGSGLAVEGETASNLCVKAYRLLQKDFPQLPPVQMHLHKAIPMGAGLGGGSADGAFTLKLLNDIFKLELSTAQLLDYALQLGSDCPFFILNKPCMATSRGEQLQEIDIDLGMYHWVLVYPGIHIPTGRAFSQLTPALPTTSLSDIIHQPVEKWPSLLMNDFEIPVCRQYPGLKNITSALYEAGAVYASMTGSGSCFYGMFPKGRLPESLAFPDSYRVFRITDS